MVNNASKLKLNTNFFKSIGCVIAELNSLYVVYYSRNICNKTRNKHFPAEALKLVSTSIDISIINSYNLLFLI